MIETIWIIVPNLIASYMVMVNNSSQMIYFTILEIMSIVGVFLYIYQTGRTVGINVKKKEQQQVAKIR